MIVRIWGSYMDLNMGLAQGSDWSWHSAQHVRGTTQLAHLGSSVWHVRVIYIVGRCLTGGPRVQAALRLSYQTVSLRGVSHPW